MRRIIRLAAAAILVAAGTLAGGSTSSVNAGAGPCTSGDTGCTRHYDGVRQFGFAVQDSDLTDNYYDCDSGEALSNCRVKGNFGAMRLNSGSYVRMCVYANTSWTSPLYWVTSHGVWASTNRAGWSLRYRTVNSC